MDFSNYFDQINLKKTPHVGVHFEQKTTPDLLWCVALVIVELTRHAEDIVFSDNDIRGSSTYVTLMRDYFSKAPQENAKGEFNKVSRYQLELLVYAGVLAKHLGRPSKYSVADREAIKFIASNDFSAAKFLSEYTNKFIIDNGLSDIFNAYKENPTQDNYVEIKDKYWDWALANTAIKGNNHDHTNRVVNKIFNIFCYSQGIPGESASRVQPGPCRYAFLIYDRKNFRDFALPAGMTRKEYKQTVLAQVDEEHSIVDAFMQKAKEAVKMKYGMDSEIKEPEYGYAPDNVVEAHHILPKQSYLQFAASKENLIALTPDQHRSRAHRGNYGRPVAPLFQAICLKIKLNHIVESLHDHEDFYNYTNFISMVNILYGWNLESSVPVNTLSAKIDEKIFELEATQ